MRAFEWFAPIVNDEVLVSGLDGVECGRTVGTSEMQGCVKVGHASGAEVTGGFEQEMMALNKVDTQLETFSE